MSTHALHRWLLIVCLLLVACNSSPMVPTPEVPTATTRLSPTTVATVVPTVGSTTLPSLPPADPSPTAAPPSPVASCAIALHEPFLGVWQETGGTPATCPIEAAYTRAGAQESFQQGRMLWVAGPTGDPAGTIYVLYENGEWALYPDTWTEGQLDRAGLTPPEGMVEPQRGFGKVWREQLGGAESSLGWATEFERPGQATVQPLMDGSFILSLDEATYHLPQGGSWTVR